MKLVRLWYNELGDSKFRTDEEFSKQQGLPRETGVDYHISFPSRRDMVQWQKIELASLVYKSRCMDEDLYLPVTSLERYTPTYKYCDDAEIAEILLYLF